MRNGSRYAALGLMVAFALPLAARGESCDPPGGVGEVVAPGYFGASGGIRSDGSYGWVYGKTGCVVVPSLLVMALDINFGASKDILKFRPTLEPAAVSSSETRVRLGDLTFLPAEPMYEFDAFELIASGKPKRSP